jgi:hypothetical protein
MIETHLDFTYQAESIEWVIEDQAYLSYDLAPPPSPPLPVSKFPNLGGRSQLYDGDEAWSSKTYSKLSGYIDVFCKKVI